MAKCLAKSFTQECKTHLPPTKYQNIQPVFQPVFVFFDFVVMLVSAKISGKIFDTRVQKHISKAKGIIPKQKKLKNNLYMCSNGGCSMERESNHYGWFQKIDPIMFKEKKNGVESIFWGVFN